MGYMTHFNRRTDKEIEELLEKAIHMSFGRTRYPMMSYEDGIKATLEWFNGETDEDILAD